MSEPLRSCCVCRLKTEKSDLIRIVKSPSGIATLDVNSKLQGRGTYICPDESCINIAEKSGNISKALKSAETTRDFWNDLRNLTHSKYTGKLNKNKIAMLLGMSRRAKNIIVGTDNIKSETQNDIKHKKLMLLYASDASESVKKFAQDYQENYKLDMSIEELSDSIGINSNVQIVAITSNSGFAKKLRGLMRE